MSTEETRTCLRCKKALPATTKYFRRDVTKPGGLREYCKACALDTSGYSQEHYNHVIETKGVLGFRCPLHTQRCGVCQTINRCWRLVGTDPVDFPEKMIGLPSMPPSKKSRFDISTSKRGE
jgi:hypothetical protein